MTNFNHVVSSLNDYKQERRQVTHAEYEEFKRHWLIYVLEEKRLGQAFCEHFDIAPTTPLFWYRDDKISEQWIQDNYIV